MGRFAARVLNLDQSPAIYPIRTIRPVKSPGAEIPAASAPSAWPTIARGERATAVPPQPASGLPVPRAAAIPAAACSVPPPASTTHRGKLGGKLGEKSSA